MCRHRTVKPNPVLVNPESFMETSRSAGACVGKTFLSTAFINEVPCFFENFLDVADTHASVFANSLDTVQE